MLISKAQRLKSHAWALTALDYYARAPKGSRIDQWKRRAWERLDQCAPKPEVVPVQELAAADYSFAELRRLSADFRRPVVVRGLFAGVPAIERWKSLEYLLERGDEVYLVSMNGRVRTQLAAAENNPKNFEQQLPFVEMRLSEIISRMRAGEPLYFIGLDTIFRRDRRLLSDLAIPQVVTEWWEGKDVPLNPIMVQMFMGMGSSNRANTTGAGLHCARHANLFIQVVGTKHWTLIDPRYSLFLHPSPRYELPTCIATPPFNLEDLPRHEFTLHPGDVLYNPPWMWHTVHNGEGWTIGCATREARFLATLRNNPMFTLLQEFTEMNSCFAARVAKRRAVGRFLCSLPFFVLGVGLAQEALRGYVNPPMRAYADFDDDERPHFVENLNEVIKTHAH